MDENDSLMDENDFLAHKGLGNWRLLLPLSSTMPGELTLRQAISPKFPGEEQIRMLVYLRLSHTLG